MVCLRASDPCVVGDGVEASKIEQMNIPLVGDEGGWAPKDGSGGGGESKTCCCGHSSQIILGGWMYIRGWSESIGCKMVQE